MGIRSMIVRVLTPATPKPVVDPEADARYLDSLGALTRCTVLAERKRRSLPPERGVRGIFTGFTTNTPDARVQQFQRQRQAALEALLRQGVGPTR